MLQRLIAPMINDGLPQRALGAVEVGKSLVVEDGDTLGFAARLRYIDTPETFFQRRPVLQWNVDLAELARLIAAGQTHLRRDGPLADYFVRRLQTRRAGSLQEMLGRRAEAELSTMIRQALGDEGTTLVVQTDPENLADRYGRVLALVALAAPGARFPPLTRTLNFLMVERGWAVPYIIYDQHLMAGSDIVKLHRAARQAWEQRWGVWDEPLGLPGYEFRRLVRLAGYRDKRQPGEDQSRQYLLDVHHPERPIIAPDEYDDRYLTIAPPDRLFGRLEELTRLQEELTAPRASTRRS